MSSESRHRGNNSNTEKKRGCLLSTRVSWTQLDEDFSSPTVDESPASPQLVDHKEENLCNWMDSGFYLSGSKDSEEGTDRAAALSPPMGMVQMTVQNYMRSLHRFSEMPVLSRWNSVNSSHSFLSAPQSVTEWLDFWEKDPVEILLDLGFGTDEPDICTKIPSRFINCASTAKGINIRVFIEAQRQRLDLESPNLCGRFRQLQVLDHVTSAFSSLLSDISAMQPEMDEGKKRENGTVDLAKGKAVVAQAKRRKIGQLLRKASRQTTMHGPQGYRNLGPCKVKEDSSVAGDVDMHLGVRTGLSHSPALVSLTEELLPNEETAEDTAVSRPIQSTASKRAALPPLPTEQLPFPSTSEMSMKDRPRKEANLLLTQTLQRVTSLSKKLSDSFEMEEIQSFEDEFAWGNPLERTSGSTRGYSVESLDQACQNFGPPGVLDRNSQNSKPVLPMAKDCRSCGPNHLEGRSFDMQDMLVTRTSSCQSDSSGFLEDPSEPASLQGLSLTGNVRLSYSTHDCQAFLRHRKDASLSSQDLLQNATGPISKISAGNGDRVPLLASLSREQHFQGEEMFYSINEEGNLYDDRSGPSGDADSGKGHETDEKEIEGRRGQLDERESSVGNVNQVDIHTPERNSFSHCSEEHQCADSVPAKEGSHSTGKTGEDKKECEEEEIRDPCQDVLEAVAIDVAKGPHDMKVYGKSESPIPLSDVTVDDQRSELKMIVRPMKTTGVSQTEDNVTAAQPEFSAISRCPLQDASQAHRCFGTRDAGSSERLAVSIERDEDGCTPGSETNTSSFKSVTVQMPSRLMSAKQSLSFSETAAKGQCADFTSSMAQSSKEEPQFTWVPKASKGEDKQTKEVCIQTDRSQRKKENRPPFQCCSSFHRHSHLVKSASLDTGLHWRCRPHHQEALNPCCAWPRGHSCSLCSCHSCFHGGFMASSWRPPMTRCSSHTTTTELQLLKTLQLLQDTTLRNISSCTAHEIETMKNSCQKFRERLDEIEQHLTEQETIFSRAMSKEGREERRRLQVLRQAVRREVAELESQLQDRARQVREGMLMHLTQLLDEQACLCSELGISDWREERETKDESLPDPSSASLLAQASCSKAARESPTPCKSPLVPSHPGSSSLREPHLPPSLVATNQTSSTSDPEEFHTSKKEPKGLSQPKLDFKAFIQNLKRSFRNSFTNDTAEGRD